MSTAIYIEHPHIIAVVMAGNAKKPRLKRVIVGKMAELRTEDGNVVVDRDKHLADEVAKFLKENKLALGKTNLLVGADAMHYREFQIAFTDRKQIDRVIRFQAEGLLPSVNIEDLAVSYHVLSSNDKGSRLLIMAADKEYIVRRIAAIEAAGVSVAQADCHLSGTLNLGLMHPTFAKGQPPAMWLDFAGTTALVSIVSDGDVLATRAFVAPYLAGATGGTARAEDSKAALKEIAAQITGAPPKAPEPPALESELDDFVVDDDEEEEVVALGAPSTGEQIYVMAEEKDLKAQGGPPTLPSADTARGVAGLPSNDSVNLGALEVADRIRRMSREDLLRFVTRVAVEARRTLYMANAGVSPARLVVSGLGREGGQLCAALANELRIERYESVDLLETINPIDEKTRKPSVETPDVGDLTYLCGVALKGMGRDFTGVDFRQGELAAGSLYDYIRTPLAFTATLVFLFAGIMFILALTQVQSLEAGIADLRYISKPSLQKKFDKTREEAISAINEAADKEKAARAGDAQAGPKIDSRRQGDIALLKKELGAYPLNDEEPAVEIRNAHKKYSDTLKRLKGEATSGYPTPHNADLVLAKVLAALSGSQPSYDFALKKVDVTQAEVTVVYYASTSETEEELRQRGRGGRSEALRLSRALEVLASSATVTIDKKEMPLFSGMPEPVGQPKPAAAGDGRTVNEITYKLPLTKVPPPARPSASKTGTTK